MNISADKQLLRRNLLLDTLYNRATRGLLTSDELDIVRNNVSSLDIYYAFLRENSESKGNIIFRRKFVGKNVKLNETVTSIPGLLECFVEDGIFLNHEYRIVNA